MATFAGSDQKVTENGVARVALWFVKLLEKQLNEIKAVIGSTILENYLTKTVQIQKLFFIFEENIYRVSRVRDPQDFLSLEGFLYFCFRSSRRSY